MNQQKIRIPKKTLFQRYPRLFVGVTTTVCLLGFFSKPIFDIFFSDHIITAEELRSTDKPKFGRK